MPATTDLETRATELLHELAGPDARFREHQLEAIADLVEDRARVLCVQRTGWGKSAVYFIATALLRSERAAPRARRSSSRRCWRSCATRSPPPSGSGIRAHTVNSTNRDAWDEISGLLAADAVDLLLISPERLNNPKFRAEMLPVFAESVGLLVVDEAHCISDWGHDFRPDYRRIADMLERLPEGVGVLCTTATANDRVVADVEEQLRIGGHEASLVAYRGPLGRSSLRFEVVELPGQADRLAWLATHLDELPGSGIVYTLTKRDAEQVAQWLNAHGVAAEAYTGEIETERRIAVEDRLLANDLQVRRRHERARDGLRQARPRLRRALPGARLGHRLLPAGRPRRPRDRARRGRPAARRRGPPHPGLLHRAGLPAPRARRPRARAPRRGRRRGRLDAGADRRSSTSAAAASTRCSRCSTSRAPSRATATAGSASPAATGPTTPSATSTSPRCAAASRRRWRASAPTGAASCARCRRSSTIPARRTAGAARSAPGPRYDGPLDPGLVREAIDHLRSQPLALETKKMAPDAEGRMRKIPAEFVVAGGPRAGAPGRRRLGRRSCARAWTPGASTTSCSTPSTASCAPGIRRCATSPRCPRRATRASSTTSPAPGGHARDPVPRAAGSAPASARASARCPTRSCRRPTCAARSRVVGEPPPEGGLLLDDVRLSGWTLAMVGGQLLPARQRAGLPARARDRVLSFARSAPGRPLPSKPLWPTPSPSRAARPRWTSSTSTASAPPPPAPSPTTRAARPPTGRASATCRCAAGSPSSTASTRRRCSSRTAPCRPTRFCSRPRSMPARPSSSRSRRTTARC